MWRYATVRRIRQAETSVLISTAVPALVSMPLLLLVLLMELLVRLLLALIVLLLALLLLRVCLMLIGRALLTLLTLLLVFLLLALIFLLLVLLFLLMRRLLLLEVALLLLTRRLVCPFLLLSEPIGTIRFYPIGILLVPPSAVMPLALLIVGAILIVPSRIERGPILMILIKPVGIVLMPPVGVAPLMLVVVVTPVGFRRSRGPVFIVQGLPYVRMGPEVMLQLRILCAPVGVVEQPGIARECPRNVRVVREEISKALVSLVLRHIVEPWVVIREAGYLRSPN